MSILKTINKYKISISAVLFGALYFAFLLMIHDYRFGDFQIFAQQEIKTFYFVDVWSQWSSRLFIESAVNALSKHVWVWQVLTVFFGALLFWSLARILRINRIWQIVLLFTIMLLINSQLLVTAGIFATTINYLWPLACLAFIAAVIIYPPQNRIARIISLIAIWPLAIFAVCSEQVAALGFILTIGYILYCVLFKEKISGYIWVLLPLFLIGIINVLVSPGNDIRTASEIANWWPEFASLSIVDKIVTGSIVTFSRIFLAPEVPAILLVIALAVLAWSKKNIRAFVSILPALAILMLFFLPDTAGEPGTYVRQVNYFNEIRNEGLYLAPNSDDIPEKIYLLIFSAITISIALAVYFLYGKSKKTLLLLGVLASGLAVSMLVSFSPTLFASSTRTLFPLMMIIVAVDFLILREVIAMHFRGRPLRHKSA